MKRAAPRMTTIVLLSCLVAGTFSWAQEPTTEPAARKVLDSVLGAYGGAAGYRKGLDSRTMAHHTSKSAQPDMRVEFDVTLYTRSDGASRQEKVVWGEKQITGFDGTKGWRQLDGRVHDLDAKFLELLEVERMQRGIFADHEKLGFIAVMGTPEKDGRRQLEHIVFRRKSALGKKKGTEKPGDRFDFYFDSESHLPARATFLCPDPYGGDDFLLTVRFEEYGKVNGFPYAKRVVNVRDGRPMFDIEIKSLEVGGKLPDRLFKRPNPAD